MPVSRYIEHLIETEQKHSSLVTDLRSMAERCEAATANARLEPATSDVRPSLSRTLLSWVKHLGGGARN